MAVPPKIGSTTKLQRAVSPPKTAPTPKTSFGDALAAKLNPQKTELEQIQAYQKEVAEEVAGKELIKSTASLAKGRQMQREQASGGLESDED